MIETYLPVVKLGQLKYVCVYTICRDVNLRYVAGGHRGPRGSVAANEDTPWVPVKTYLFSLIVPPVGAYKSQLGGSTSTVIIRLYLYVYSSCHFIVGVFCT